jgi:hypothetical protein
LPGGGEVIAYKGPDDRVPTYHLWKNGSFASWTLRNDHRGGHNSPANTVKQVWDVSIPADEDESLRKKIEAALISYWNSMTPIPEPQSWGEYYSMKFGGEPPRWGFLEDLQHEADVGDLKVKTFKKPGYGDEVVYYITTEEPVRSADFNDRNTVTMTRHKGGGKNNEPDSFRLDGPQDKVAGPVVARFLNALRWTGNLSRAEEYKVYRQGGEWFAGFDPERLGYESLNGVFYYKPGSTVLVDPHGDAVLNAREIHGGLGRAGNSADTMQMLAKNAASVAGWINGHLPRGVMGTFKKGAKETLAQIGLIYDSKKAQFKTATEGKALFRQRGMTATMNGNLIDIRNTADQSVATFKRDNENRRWWHFTAFSAAASREDKRNAMLAMADWETQDPEKRDVSFGLWAELAKLGLVQADGKDPHPAITDLTTRHPEREVVTFEDGMSWFDAAYTSMDQKCVITSDYRSSAQSLAHEIKGHRYVLRDATNNDLVRVLANNQTGGKGRVYSIWIMHGNTGARATAETLEPYIDHLQALLKREMLPVRNSYFVPQFHLIQRSDATLEPLPPTSRFRQFIDGQITYEDGHKWVRGEHEKQVWSLMAPGQTSFFYFEMKVTLKNGHIEEVKYAKSAHTRPRDFMPFYSDFVDIIHDLNANPLKGDVSD